MTVVYFRFKSPLELIIIIIKSERGSEFCKVLKRLQDDSNQQQQNLLRDLSCLHF